ncbi:hypothetical protein AB0I91_08965 [Actinosynnema sp. NPDC049800]
MPGTVTGGGGGAGCGSGVVSVVSVAGAGVEAGAGEDGSDVGAAEETDEETDEAAEDGAAAGPEASDVPQAVARNAIATSAALRIAQTPQRSCCVLTLETPSRRLWLQAAR